MENDEKKNMCGYLKTKSSNNRPWSKKYFLIDGTHLKWYVNNTLKAEKGSILLSNTILVLNNVKKKSFLLVFEKKTCYIQTNNPQDKKLWIKALKSAGCRQERSSDPPTIQSPTILPSPHNLYKGVSKWTCTDCFFENTPKSTICGMCCKDRIETEFEQTVIFKSNIPLGLVWKNNCVTMVIANTQGSEAGIQAGWHITAVNGKVISGPEDPTPIEQVIAAQEEGKVVEFSFQANLGARESRQEEDKRIAEMLENHNLQMKKKAEKNMPGNKQGFLRKRGEVNSAWKNRWCILDGAYLIYSNSKNAKQHKGKILLAISRVHDEQSKNPLEFQIQVNGQKTSCCTRTFFFLANNVDDKTNWMIAIQKSITFYQQEKKSSNVNSEFPIELKENDSSIINDKQISSSPIFNSAPSLPSVDSPGTFPIIESEPSVPRLEGYLMKKGGVNTSWKKRYFIVKKQEIIYYVENGSSEQKGSILLHKAIILEDISELETEFQIQPIRGARTYNLQANTVKEKKQWIKVLKELTKLEYMIIIEGWLQKKGRTGNWENRYVVINEALVSEYKHDTNQFCDIHNKVTGQIILESITNLRVCNNDTKEKREFGLETSTRMYHYRVCKEEDLPLWISAIQSVTNITTMEMESRLSSDEILKRLPSRDSFSSAIKGIRRSQSSIEFGISTKYRSSNSSSNSNDRIFRSPSSKIAKKKLFRSSSSRSCKSPSSYNSSRGSLRRMPKKKNT